MGKRGLVRALFFCILPKQKNSPQQQSRGEFCIFNKAKDKDFNKHFLL